MTIEFQYITDVEGDLVYFKKQINNSKIVQFTNEEENELEFIAPEKDTRLVFGGDVCDAGYDITVANMLIKLKEKYPERVILILGNRDGNKPRFSTELPLSPFESLNDTIDDVLKPAFTDKCRSFRDFLVAKFKAADESLNTPVNRLKWILEETMGAPRAFASRREELAVLKNKSIISDEEVFISFRESVEPHGFMRRYLSLAQIGVIIGDTIIAHGSFLPTSIGKVPNGFIAFEEKALATKSSLFQPSGPDMLQAEDVHEWIDQLNAWYRSAVERWINTTYEHSSYQFSNNVPSSPIQHIASGPGSKFSSRTPVVGSFLKDRRTPWMIDEKVADFLEKGAIKRVIVGHQPHGDTPLFIVGYPGEEISRYSPQVFTCDTFYGHKNAYHSTDGAKIRLSDPRGS